MTKRKEKRYREIMQRKENNLFPERNRTVIKVLSVNDQSWGSYLYVFTEKVRIDAKRYYCIDDLKYGRELGNIPNKELIKKHYMTERGRIPALVIDYGDTRKTMVSGKSSSLVPIFCSNSYFEEVEIGSKIIIYGLKHIGYDGSMLTLFAENLW